MAARFRAWLGATDRATAVVWAALLLFAVLAALPLAIGARTLFLRDALGIHFPLKAFGAEQLRAGNIPALNPTLGLGQPFRGNPQTLAFYPDNLLYLMLPLWSAFNLHFVVHWFLALFGMRALARAMGISPPGAMAAGVTYAGGGWFLSTMSSYNLVTVAALWPLVLLGARRGGRQGVAIGGLALGAALLGGEPVSAALGLVPLAMLAIEAHGLRRGAKLLGGMAILGALVALPQIVATARILPFTFRAAHGVGSAQAGQYWFHPLRLIELVLPLPFGWPGRSGPLAWWAMRLAPRPPLFYSVYFGIVGLWLAMGAVRRKHWWSLLAGSGVLLAALGGSAPGLFVRLSAGVFRYPEKFLFWTALAGALLVGWGFEAALERIRLRRVAVLAAVLAILGCIILAWRSFGGVANPVAIVQSSIWSAYLLVAAVLIAAAAWAARRGSAAGLLTVQILGLLQLAPLLATTPTGPLSSPSPWARQVAPGASVLNTALVYPRWSGPSSGVTISLPALGPTLAPAPNVAFGLRYPISSDFEGMASPLQTLLLGNLSELAWSDRVAWFRTLGVSRLVAFEDADAPGLEVIDRASIDGRDARLIEVADPAPEAWWPEAIHLSDSPLAAMLAVQTSRDPVRDVEVSGALEHHAGGTVRVLRAEPDRIELAVEGGGGLAVVRRNFDPLWVARDSRGTLLRTVAVNLVLLGVVVPPGPERVVLEVSPWPERSASLLALLALFAAVKTLVASRRPRSTPEPR